MNSSPVLRCTFVASLAASMLWAPSADASPSSSSWPSTSLLAQDGEGGALPPPDELQANEPDEAPSSTDSSPSEADADPAEQQDPADGEPSAPPPQKGDDPGTSGELPPPDDGRVRTSLPVKKAFGSELRENIPDLPAPVLGALAAAAPVAAVQTGVVVLSASMLTAGWLVDRFVTLSFLATFAAAAVTGLVMLLGAAASSFLAGGAILWVLGNESTDTEWEHLLMATLAVVLFFIVAPLFIAAEFMGLPCGSMCCPPGGLNAFAPRISRPIFWMLGAGIAGAVVGGLTGGVIGYALTGPGAITPALAALSLGATLMGVSMGFAIGGGFAAPLGAAVGGSFGIMAPATGE